MWFVSAAPIAIWIFDDVLEMCVFVCVFECMTINLILS